jgi:hypothetical protein
MIFTVLFTPFQSPAAARNLRVVVVNRPTIIAFFPPVTDEELSKSPDTNEALADFQYYAKRARKELQEAGIDFVEVYTTSFAVKSDRKTTVFRGEKTNVGYYFVAPGKASRIEYGVMTDSDILRIATEYFRLMNK